MQTQFVVIIALFTFFLGFRSELPFTTGTAENCAARKRIFEASSIHCFR